MDVWVIADGGVEQKAVEELELLIALQEGLVWVDIPTCDEEGIRVLSEVLGFHPLAVRDCVERNQVPKPTPTRTMSSSSCTPPSAAGAAASITSSSTSSWGLGSW
jgi:Mg2+ and Co2+ transporter CorA